MGLGPSRWQGEGVRARTFDPHVGGCCNGKDQEEEDEDEGLQVVCCHPLDPKEDGAQQLALEGRRGRGLSWEGGRLSCPATEDWGSGKEVAVTGAGVEFSRRADHHLS